MTKELIQKLSGSFEDHTPRLGGKSSAKKK